MKILLQFLAPRSSPIPILIFWFCTGVLLLVFHPAPAATNSSTALQADQAMTRGLPSFQHGQFEQAVRAWAEAVRLYETVGKTAEQIDALAQLAEAYQSLGKHPNALDSLQRALKR